MKIKNLNIGYAITGAFGMVSKAIDQIREIVSNGANVIPIMSEHCFYMDTKYGRAFDFIEDIKGITGKNNIVHSIQEAEDISNKYIFDAMVFAPVSSNTISKLANNINDTAITMTAKSYLQHNKPIILGISVNDGLSGCAENIGKLLNRKNYYFIPFRQSNPITKPHFLLYDPKLTIKTIEMSIDGEQIEPILL